MGGDLRRVSLSSGSGYFNPLRPCGRRRARDQIFDLAIIFQSTPPVWAETQPDILYTEGIYQFQSTPPVWAETAPRPLSYSQIFISIHSARVGGDLAILIVAVASPNFNPLRPCGRRRARDQIFDLAIIFQSTPPVWAETVF